MAGEGVPGGPPRAPGAGWGLGRARRERGAAYWEELWETKWARPPIWSFRQKEGVWVFNLILVRSP